MKRHSDIEHVVLLHGLGRSKQIMEKMAGYLRLHGYVVHNFGYPSTRQPIEGLAEEIYQRVIRLTQQVSFTLHLVGHSLGGIIIRRLLQQHQLPHLGRVVLLGVPNQGTKVVDFLEGFRFYRRIYGPAGCQLGTKNNALLESLPDATNYECGVIAGNRASLLDQPFSWLILKEDNDGKVCVTSTRLPGMKAQIVVPASHSHLPFHAEVMRQTALFLAHGQFEQRHL